MKPEQPAPKPKSQKQQRQKIFQQTYRAFLEQFAGVPSVKAAAEFCHIDRGDHYKWLREDPEYRREWEAIQEQAGQSIEDEIVRRAMEGVKRPVMYKGKQVKTGKGRGTRLLWDYEFSDTLLLALAKRFRPNLYREHVTTEVTGSIDIVERLNAGRQRVLAMRQKEEQKAG